MTKFKEYFDRMLIVEKDLFKEFEDIHDRYVLEPDKLQEELNKKGSEAMKVIRIWEGKLCSQSEKGGYGGYTSSLAEKFWSEVRKKYPAIDKVGIIIRKKEIPSFNLKKINL